jgi:hypothetical protein
MNQFKEQREKNKWKKQTEPQRLAGHYQAHMLKGNLGEKKRKRSSKIFEK